MSYINQMGESHNNESWIGPNDFIAYKDSGYTLELKTPGYEDAMESLAKYLDENGPFDGLCGFDMGACLALEAARRAQEGDEKFANRFRYMILFSARGHRELADFGQGMHRPKAPLQIPTFLGWSEEDDSKQYGAYEEFALYIHPDFRMIFK